MEENVKTAQDLRNRQVGEGVLSHPSGLTGGPKKLSTV